MISSARVPLSGCGAFKSAGLESEAFGMCYAASYWRILPLFRPANEDPKCTDSPVIITVTRGSEWNWYERGKTALFPH